MRPLCICGFRPAAINYKKNNKIYYRKKCDTCLKASSVGVGIPKWQLSGYIKKNFCEKCKFTSFYTEQFNVYHIDGNLSNCKRNNLKTICANCQRILHREGVKWKQGDLVPDF
jgi:hypothetical protein